MKIIEKVMKINEDRRNAAPTSASQGLHISFEVPKSVTFTYETPEAARDSHATTESYPPVDVYILLYSFYIYL